ncbi:EI24 domain-containing protein [Pseudoclavibacter endophyticus]|uniref:EI24 domain-containing protein n=1 Tax=Pseudoclavibacter endophyticus TaxID=1778590 RepID=A0A6H9WGN6_9MICO|nr:EI24 domain-containing protein [Pseudoclavibacter endophyticus]
MSDFFLGLRLFVRGFGMWGRSPRLMALGAIPGLIVSAVYLAAIVTLAVFVPGIAEWATPFADEWDAVWRDGVRVLVGVAIVAAAIAVGALTFAAVTLTVASPFSEQIARLTDRRLGAAPEGADERFWTALGRGIGDGVVLVGTALLSGVAVFLLGLIPLVGGVLGWTTGAVLGGRALAIELTGTPGDDRGLTLTQRQRLLASRRALSLGFGIGAYLSFLVPGGAVVATPALSAGGVLLLRELVGEPTQPTPPPRTTQPTRER